jgi:ketosteroid isomerase-like protein
MDRKRRNLLKSAGLVAVVPAISSSMQALASTGNDTLVKTNLATVAAHFHNESANDVDKACALYTEDIVWEAPARHLLFKNKKDVAANYRKMFKSMEHVEFQSLQRFATEDRVFDDSIFRCKVTGPDFLPVPSGSMVEMRLVHMFEMRDGKIAKETAFEMWKVV